jgi:hypothetical protein
VGRTSGSAWVLLDPLCAHSTRFQKADGDVGRGPEVRPAKKTTDTYLVLRSASAPFRMEYRSNAAISPEAAAGGSM